MLRSPSEFFGFLFQFAIVATIGYSLGFILKKYKLKNAQITSLIIASILGWTGVALMIWVGSDIKYILSLSAILCLWMYLTFKKLRSTNR